jgi:hypothetical protein
MIWYDISVSAILCIIHERKCASVRLHRVEAPLKKLVFLASSAIKREREYGMGERRAYKGQTDSDLLSWMGRPDPWDWSSVLTMGN